MSTTTSTPRKIAAKKPGKAPTDHLTRKAEATETPATITATVEDVEYVIDVETMNDVEVMEMIADIQYNEEIQLAPLVLRKIVGVPAWNAWKNAHRDAETGRVPAEQMSTFLFSLFAEFDSGN